MNILPRNHEIRKRMPKIWWNFTEIWRKITLMNVKIKFNRSNNEKKNEKFSFSNYRRNKRAPFAKTHRKSYTALYYIIWMKLYLSRILKEKWISKTNTCLHIGHAPSGLIFQWLGDKTLKCEWKCANKTKPTIYTTTKHVFFSVGWQHDIGVVKRHHLIRCVSYGNSMATKCTIYILFAKPFHVKSIQLNSRPANKLTHFFFGWKPRR